MPANLASVLALCSDQKMELRWQDVLVGTMDAGVMRVSVSTVHHGIGLSVVGDPTHPAFNFHFRLLAPAADVLSGVLRWACEGKSDQSDRVFSRPLLDLALPEGPAKFADCRAATGTALRQR